MRDTYASLGRRGIPSLCSGEQVVKPLVCQVCACVYASVYACVRACVLRCRECPCLSRTSVSTCVRGCGTVCGSALFTSWPRRWRPVRVAMRRVCALLSSLYSNDRPCCFTCCVGQSVALSLHPRSKTSTRVPPVQITWVSPYLLRPSTDQINCMSVSGSV